MAQDLRRWLLAIGLGGAALAVACLPPSVLEPREPQVTVSPERSLEERLRTALANAQRRAERAAHGERLVRLSRADRRGLNERVRVVFEGGFPPHAQRLVRERADSIWNTVVPPNPQANLFLVVAATRSYSAQMVPPSAGDTTCSVMVTSRSTEVTTYYVQPERLAVVLAPCAYHAAFGLPGAAVGRWLQQRSYDVAGSIDWSGALRDPDLTSLEEMPLYERLLMNMFYTTFRQDNIMGLACAKGRLDRCQAAILTRDSPQSRTGTGGVYSIGFGTDYLASLVHQMGRERFARFWRSAQPVEQAFEDAFGLGLGQWTSQINRSWRPVIPRDTNPGVAEWLVGILTIAAAAAGAAALAKHRQVA